MNTTYKGKYFKRIFSGDYNDWIIVIPTQEPCGTRFNTIQCKVIYSPNKDYQENELTDLFYNKLIPMTQEEVMLEIL